MFDFLTSISVRKRLVYGFGILNTFILAMGVVAIVQLYRIGQSNDEIQSRYTLAATLPNDAESEYLRMRAICFTASVSTDPTLMQGFIEQFATSNAKLTDIIRRYDSLNIGLTTDSQRLYAEFKKDIAGHVAVHQKTFEALKAGSSEEARAMLAMPDVIQTFTHLSTTLSKLIINNKKELDHASEKIHSANRVTQFIMLGFMLCLNVIGFVAANAIANSIVPPVESLLRATQKVIEGDLTVTVSTRGNDEIGLLRKNFNSMIETIRLSKEETEREQNNARTKAKADLEKAEQETHYLEESVNKIRQGLHHLAQGDFSLQLEHDRDDSIGQLCHSYNNTTENMSRLVLQVMQSVDVTADIANQISSSATEMAATSEQQV